MLYRDLAVGWLTRHWVLFLAAARDFSLLKSVKTYYGVHCVLETISLEEEWWRYDIDHLSAFMVEDKNMWCYLQKLFFSTSVCGTLQCNAS
jgi:hypothetical protein